MAKFKKGGLVTVNYPDGTQRFGSIAARVGKRQLPNPKKFRFSKKPAGLGRDHISYVVESGGKYYWPLVKYLA